MKATGVEKTKKAKKAKSRRLLCVDCGVDTLATGQYYIVRRPVWAASGLGRQDGMLCLDCLERRLGRRLRNEDFDMPPACWRKRQTALADGK
jgi:hypothetical protein